MEPLGKPKIKSCRGCQSRSVEPNCHSYCPTYLAERMALDAENAAERKQSAVQHGITNQRNSCYLRHEKKMRKNRR